MTVARPTHLNCTWSAALALLLVLALAVGCTPLTDWVPAKTEVPKRVEIPILLAPNGIPFIALDSPAQQSADPEVRSYGMIDTGAGLSVVSPRFVRERGLKRRGEPKLELSDAHENRDASQWVVTVGQLNLGVARFANFDAVIRELPPIPAGAFDIVLGRPLFENVLVTIDYGGRWLILENGSLPEPNGRDILPLRRTQRRDLLVPVTIGGEGVWMILDTGVGRGGTPVASKRADSLKWASAPVEFGLSRAWMGERRARVGRIDGDFKLGQYTIRRPIAAVIEKGETDYLGADILHHFVVTIDQKNRRVRFALPGDSSQLTIDTPPMRTLGFRVIDSVGTVEVTPDSEAARAGLQNGDRILAIEDVPLARYTNAHHETLERRGLPLKMRISRAGRVVTLGIPLTTVVP